MGNSQVQTQRLIAVSEVKQIPKDPKGPEGLFARRFIAKGSTLLYGTDEDVFMSKVAKATRPVTTFMNDRDFNYPKDFSEEALRKSIGEYEKLDGKTKNNVGMSGTVYTALRDIYFQDEITRRYGLLSWIVFLFLEIHGKGTHKEFPELERNKAIGSLLTVAEEYGYKITVAGQASDFDAEPFMDVSDHKLKTAQQFFRNVGYELIECTCKRS